MTLAALTIRLTFNDNRKCWFATDLVCYDG